MLRHRTATAWFFAMGLVLLVLGIWLASLTMKRSQRTRSSKFPMPAARKMWTLAKPRVAISCFSFHA